MLYRLCKTNALNIITGSRRVICAPRTWRPFSTAVKGRLKILLTFRAFLTGLLLGATGGFIRLRRPGLRPDR